MQILQEQIGVHPEIEVTYFTENEMGGAYAVYAGRVRRIEEVPTAIVFMDGKRIWVGDIACMESEIFERYELWLGYAVFYDVWRQQIGCHL